MTYENSKPNFNNVALKILDKYHKVGKLKYKGITLEYDEDTGFDVLTIMDDKTHGRRIYNATIGDMRKAIWEKYGVWRDDLAL